MNLKSGNIETFEQYSQFETLKEFNNHMEMWLLKHKDDFSKGELVGLKRLVRYAAKFPGVCNAKIATVLKSIHHDYNEHGISRSTFKRMITKAKEFGIFTVYETERKNGGQSSNLYVFNRFPTNEPPQQEILNRPKETSNLLKTEKDQKIKKRKDESSSNNNGQQHQELDYTFVSNRVPKTFVDFVKCFFPEAKVIEEYWHMVHILAYDYQWHEETERIVHIAIESFRQLIRKLKFTKSVKNPIAYFFGIIKQKFASHFEELQAEHRAAGLIDDRNLLY